VKSQWYLKNVAYAMFMVVIHIAQIVALNHEREDKMLKKTDDIVSYKGYVHLQSYEPEGILELVDVEAEPIELLIEGSMHQIKICSQRLRCFKRSRTCVKCGLEGTIMSVDTFISTSDRDSTHVNLYAVFEGETRLMTKDHIMPKAAGGANHMDNLQTMCDQCNNRKGSSIITETVAPFGDTLNISIGE